MATRGVVATAFAFIVVGMMICLPCVSAVDCGWEAGGALCRDGLCCSEWGWCGNTPIYCGPGCQSQCGGWTPPPPSPSPPPPSPSPPPPPPTPTPPSPTPGGEGVASIITEDIFNQLLLHRDHVDCPARGFYTYSAFIEAAKAFPEFGTTGDIDTRTTELAAFFAQTSHETRGGWPAAPDGQFAWGYCHKEELDQSSDYCQAFNMDWPCVPGKKYFGRGPIQLSWNYNYGPAGRAIGFDGLGNPDIVAADPIVSFKAALWFWMTPQPPKPSCHDVMIGTWIPSYIDIAAGRLPGFGVVTNIINGGLECGIGPDPRQESRIGFYKRYCDILGVSYGSNLDCNNQRHFGFTAKFQPGLIKTVV